MDTLIIKLLLQRKEKLQIAVKAIDEAIVSIFQSLDDLDDVSNNDHNDLDDIDELLKRIQNGKYARSGDGNKRKTPPFNLDKAVIEAIVGKRRFLHVREIRNYVQKNYPQSKEYSNILGSISQSLNRLKAQHKIVNHQEGGSNRNNFWGFSKWMDDSGIKPNYEYNREYLTSTAFNSIDDLDIDELNG